MSLFSKLFGSSSKASDDVKEADQNARMSIYVFDPYKIGASVSLTYRAYAQALFLGAIHAVVQPHGGWKILPLSGVIGCHGDFSDEDVFGKPMGTKVLSDWVRPNSTVDVRLASDFLNEIKVDPTKVGIIPYAIGLWPMSESFSISIHSALLSSDAIGYLGSISVEPNPRLPFLKTQLSAMQEAGLSGSDCVFSAIASTLCLSVNMGIRANGQCFGWLISETEIKKFGLSILEQTSKETLLGQKIAEAKHALGNGDIKLAISLLEEAAKLASNEKDRNKFLEQAENLRKIL